MTKGYRTHDAAHESEYPRAKPNPSWQFRNHRLQGAGSDAERRCSVTRRQGHPAWNYDATGPFTGAARFGLRTSKNTRVNRLRHSSDWCDSWAKENAGVPTNDTNENPALLLNVEIGPPERRCSVTRRRGHPAWNYDATGPFTGAAWFGLRTSKNTRVNRLRHSCDWCDSWAKENAAVPTNDTNENPALLLNVEIGSVEQYIWAKV